MNYQSRLTDGFATLITLENIPNVKIYETEVTPPSISIGKSIDLTSMRNTAWRTAAPAQLKTPGNVTATVAFATEALSDIEAQVGVNQLITVTFPDNSTYEFYGWVDSFIPGKFSEGAQPTATLTIMPSLRDASGNETAPAYHPAS